MFIEEHGRCSVSSNDIAEGRAVSPIDEEHPAFGQLLLAGRSEAPARDLYPILQLSAIPRVAGQCDPGRCLLRSGRADTGAKKANRKTNNETEGSKQPKSHCHQANCVLDFNTPCPNCLTTYIHLSQTETQAGGEVVGIVIR